MSKRILVQSEIYKIYDLDGSAIVTIDKGYILFCTESGQEVKLKANSLGDGIKRLVSFFKDLKKEMEKSQSPRDDPLESYVVEKLLKKHEIDLEAV